MRITLLARYTSESLVEKPSLTRGFRFSHMVSRDPPLSLSPYRSPPPPNPCLMPIDLVRIERALDCHER
ncbi:MAG: hypothetical protein NTW75_09765 [Planctomycetales bacterium]|nr:hypothetical protein [Planctomycetales bacterium]